MTKIINPYRIYGKEKRRIYLQQKDSHLSAEVFGVCLLDKLISKNPAREADFRTFVRKNQIDWYEFYTWLKKHGQNIEIKDSVLHTMVTLRILRVLRPRDHNIFWVCRIERGFLISHISYSFSKESDEDSLLNHDIFISDEEDAHAFARACIRFTQNVQLRETSEHDRRGRQLEIKSGGMLGKRWIFKDQETACTICL